jgi:hypothetical protein
MRPWARFISVRRIGSKMIIARSKSSYYNKNWEVLTNAVIRCPNLWSREKRGEAKKKNPMWWWSLSWILRLPIAWNLRNPLWQMRPQLHGEILLDSWSPLRQPWFQLRLRLWAPWQNPYQSIREKLSSVLTKLYSNNENLKNIPKTCKGGDHRLLEFVHLFYPGMMRK